MRRWYVVTAQRIIHRAVSGAQITIQVPTFILDADVQGIMSIEQAEQIAIEIVAPPPSLRMPIGNDWCTVSVSVVEVNSPNRETEDPDESREIDAQLSGRWEK